MAVLILLIVATSLQVVTRYILNASLSWTDELSRYCFIWCSMIGATVACYRGSHAAVDVLVQNLKGRVKSFHKTLVYLIIIYIAAVLAVEGCRAVQTVHAQRSTALHLPMSAVYVSLPISAVVIMIQSLLSIIGLYQTEKDGTDPSGPSEEPDNH